MNKTHKALQHTQMYYNSCSAQVHNIFQDLKSLIALICENTFSGVLFDHTAVMQLSVTNDQHSLMELLSCFPPLDGSEALCQTGALPLCVCCCHCWLAVSYLFSDPSFLL